MDNITEIITSLHLSPGWAALIIQLVLLFGSFYRSMSNGAGLIGSWKNFLYGQNVPKPIAQDYKEELKKKEPGTGVGPLLLLAGILSLLSIGFVGCGTVAKDGVYHGDKTLFVADQTIVSSYSVFHSFVKFEYANREALAYRPEIKRAADNIRLNSRNWIESAIALRDAYELKPDASSALALNRAVAVLQAALGEASGYLIAQTETATPKK